ncbi:MAG: sulfatase-like hydrolase/transferase, partial [Deltaproteobacteria bacterium]|nr:sulfatase-like hydrolase/transferase [Deltaproteobacteria bacterium]
VDNLKRLKLTDNGMICIFSDHGEGKISPEFPDRFTHGGDVFDNVIRVPLLLRHKDLARTVTDRLVSLVDIAPTVLSLALQKDARDL